MSLQSPAIRLAVPKPLYSQVRDMLAQRISGGEWSAGGTLPNENTLASEFGVSIGTIRRAVEGLEDIGLVIRKQGRGTFVMGATGAAHSLRHGSLRTVDGRLLDLTYRQHRAAERPATRTEARSLKLPDGARITDLQGTVHANGRIVGLETSLLPAGLLGMSSDAAQSAEPDPDRPALDRPVFERLAEVGQVVVRIEEIVTATAATATDQAGEFKPGIGTPLLSHRRRGFAADDRLLIEQQTVYLASDVSFHNVRG